MKQCKRCKEEKPFDEFYKNSKREDGHQDYCKSCKKEYDKKQWVNHGDKWRPLYAERKKQMTEWLTEYKKQQQCSKCGDDRYYVLDFHHLDPTQKDIEVSNAICSSITRAEEEIKKCIPLCRNCHSEFHHLERLQNIQIQDYLVL